ncbi:MAG: IclR family transcriptional regulator [Deltaproteobacteria bacterium]|nr:IclR family transcriptional regulator [Deltaproteobacteria bacterium]
MKSLQKALDIIDMVAERGSAGIRDLSAWAGFPPATTHRIVSTLTERRYLEQDPLTKKYSLSLRFLELGSKVQQKFNLLPIARPQMERLMRETRESVNLAVRDGDEMVYLEQVRSDYALLQLFTRPGARVHLYNTGVGKLFLSQMSQKELGEYLARTRLVPRTPNTITGRDALKDELEIIRSRGFSVDNEEFEQGVRCVASLVFDHRHLPVAAISISGAAVRITPDEVQRLGHLVKEAALSISSKLGFET